MPKKQRNSFYFFMKDLQEEYRMRGQTITMKDLPALAHPLWLELPDDEKRKYDKMARDFKKESKEDIAGKLCSDRTLLKSNLLAKQEQEEKEEEAMKFVDRLVSQIDSVSEVTGTTFFIMAFNVLCYTDDDGFIPLEVGIAKYSIKKGIEDYFQMFINPSEIPLGYTRVAMQHSEDTHKIPTSGFEFAENDYSKICKSIENFVNSDEASIAPVFCLEENIEQNQGCLDWLQKKDPYSNIGCIQYFNLTYLLMELRAYVNNSFPTKTVASDMLRSHLFDFTPNISCQFHEEIDNPYCALSCAKRLCFILSDALCELYEIDCTPCHLPPRVGNDNEFKTYQPKLPRSLPIKNNVDVPVKPPKPHVITSIVKKEVSNKSNNETPPYNHCVLQNNSTSCSASAVSDCDKSEKLFSINEFPALNNPKDSENDSSEVRQPKTLPLVLRGLNLNQDKRYAAFSLGRGIGRGKNIL